MKKCDYVVVWFLICSFSGLILCDVTLQGVRCGELTCKRGDYCDDQTRRCNKCSDICTSNHHNFDNSLCLQKCQDYVHDALYVLKDDSKEAGSTDLRATVQTLSHRLTIVLILLTFILVILAFVFCLQLYRWAKKHNISVKSVRDKIFKKNSNEQPTKSPVAVNLAEKPDLRLEIHNPSTQSDHSPVTVTTTISRRPAEDSTLDYAYDNPAMSSSPTVHKSNQNSF